VNRQQGADIFVKESTKQNSPFSKFHVGPLCHSLIVET
jgi:hypothetical protein